MTTPFLLTTCAVSIVIIAVLWLCPLASLRRDNFRTDVRIIRDDLFDFMWENGFSFDTPAYRDARQFLNGLLRASTCMSPTTFILGLWYCIWYRLGTDEEFIDYSNCPAKLAQKLEQATDRGMNRFQVLLFREGLLGPLIMLFFRTIVLAIKGRKRLSEITDRAVRHLAIDAYSLGAPLDEMTLSQRSLVRC
jgi:hypothetical protein